MSDVQTATCAYCGKVRPVGELKAGRITYIDIRTEYDRRGQPRHRKFVGEKVNLYCADGPCHQYDQMAHEG